MLSQSGNKDFAMFLFLSRVIVDNVLINGGRWQRLVRCRTGKGAATDLSVIVW